MYATRTAYLRLSYQITLIVFRMGPKYNIKYDDGPLRPELVTGSRIKIKYYIAVSDGIHV